MICAYCQKAPGVQRDHVVAKAMRRRHHIAASDARFHVRCCMTCNVNKLSRKLYPRGFDISILPGKGWREWDGDPTKIRGAYR